MSTITSAESTEMDLPLSANTADVKLKHFVMDLECDMDDKKLEGSVTLFCYLENHCRHQSSSDIINTFSESSSIKSVPFEHSRPQGQGNSVIILDCFNISITSVEEITVQPELEHQIKKGFRPNLNWQCRKSDNGEFENNIGEKIQNNHDIKFRTNFIEGFQSDTGNISQGFQSNSKNGFRTNSVQEFQTNVNKRFQTSSSAGFQINNCDQFQPDACDKDVDTRSKASTSDNCVSSDKQFETNASKDDDDDVFIKCSRLPGHQVNFSMSKHCVTIPRITAIAQGISVIRIHYNTNPDGPSLKWTLDQNGSPCVFTVGHWLDNRSWFPSQDAPAVLTTWQACVTVTSNLVVLMSGDTNPAVSTSPSGKKIFSFYTTMPMPTSTLALAIGSWTQTSVTEGSFPGISETSSIDFLCTRHSEKCETNFSNKQVLPCRLFAPESLLTQALSELEHYIPVCFREVYNILGHHPFQRLDILIVPACFDSLGMTSPSLLFLSQSVLAGDQSMCARVAHELCHSWFGLLIGPKDWTEEWLTEGFCTYLEDILHARVMGWQNTVMTDHLSLRSLLKERILRAEIENTEENLQTLRPNKGEEILPTDSNTGVQFVKNGMNPNKTFMQVHYLKGFFLLKFLENVIGVDRFLALLKDYVTRFHGELVSSQDFFDLLFSSCPELSDLSLSKEQLIEEWLDGPGIPESLENIAVKENKLLDEVNAQLSEIHKLSSHYKRSPRKKRKYSSECTLYCRKFHPDQLVLLLDLLLDEEYIPKQILDDLRNKYSLHNANAEIRHRWCELVVREKAVKYYDDVRSFLVQHQAMGVYFYGEMVISGCGKQKNIAVECFHLLKEDMPEGVIKTIHSMLYGD